jgi:hypothetical protein
MYEVMWDTTPFNDKSIWPEDGSQPFVYSMGDATGYGQHGDYVFGWKEGALQKAMDQRCFGNSCKGLQTQEASDSTNCAVAQTVKEPVNDCMSVSSTNLSSMIANCIVIGLSELPGGPTIVY